MSDDRDLPNAALARLWISGPAFIQQPKTMMDGTRGKMARPLGLLLENWL